ncbi:hypothetical protein [Curtobacterium sp. VKM Ac-1376]|uniref:MmyB family transcriptional regulator n=1 Tax=Curtobacterium sp. VKM Ac-1376 TaxID=123312 RepID=UPI00188C72DE|nr:hypothetical protein [Curtobacterium sp. VKM Ac-1376]MBF4613426.1 hypothetical protein [Curtobacterium sp. VKM Ac-1376]
MSRNDAGEHAPDGVSEMVAAIGCLPAVVTDRHLTVVSSNPLARALSGAFEPSVNMARYTFLDPVVDDDAPGWSDAAGQIAAMLRDSLDQHEEDAGFRALVGELSSQSIDFARAWAHDARRPARTGTVRFAPVSVGPLTMVFQELLIPDDFALRMLLWRPDGTPDARAAFARLVARAADDG